MLFAPAGAQEAVGGGANKNGHVYKEAMKEMPRLKEARTITVKGTENWDKTLGFGKDSSMMEMMTLMMVGGSGMEHMKMAGMSSKMHMGSSGEMETGGSDSKGMAMETAQGLPVTVALKQNPPVVGENTMDVTVTDASGKPVTGLKLMATVAMTSMDMGTEHPKLVEGKDGHYSVPVKFSMKGPWRVMLTNDGTAGKSSVVHTSLDFNVDGKTKWTQPKPIVNMNMAAGETVSGDKLPENKLVEGIKISSSEETAKKQPAVNTVETKASASETAQGTKASATETAAGAKKPAVPTTATWNITVNTDAKTLAVGKNKLEVTILDADGKPVTGAKVMGSVEMTSMDMGVTKPKAQEGKNGHYTVPVEFSMKGPWRVTLTVTPPKQKPFTKALEFNIPR